MKNVFVSDNYGKDIDIQVRTDFFQTLLKGIMIFLSVIVVLSCAFCCYIFLANYKG